MVLLTSLLSVNTCGHRWAEEPEQWTGKRHFIFLLPSSRTSHSFCALRKMQHSPRLAHKALVTQATSPSFHKANCSLIQRPCSLCFRCFWQSFHKLFPSNSIFIQLHANKDFQSSCELVTYANSKFQRLSTHIIQELLLSILERYRPRKQFSLRSGHLHVHTSQSLRTVYFSTTSNNLSN